MLCDEPPLPFLASLSSDESTDSTGTGVSRFLGEEDLIDSLFFTCDIDRSGKVPVSKIVEYLKYITEDDQKNENIDLFVQILDPDLCDPAIDLATYRKGTEEWIERLRLMEVEESPGDLWAEHAEVFSTSLPGSPSILRPLLHRFLQADSYRSPSAALTAMAAKDLGCSPAAMAASPVSIEGSVGTEQHSFDMSSMMSRIADLEHQNRRLTDELKSVRGRLELSEDASAGIAAEEERMRAERKVHYETVERLGGLRIEREELKIALGVVTEAKKRLQIQIHEAERENGTLHEETHRLQNQVREMQSETEQLKDEKEELIKSAQDQKVSQQEACGKSEAQATALAEKTCQLEELQKTVADMNQLNKSLRVEKVNLEQHLTETLHELSTRTRKETPGADKDKSEDSDEEIMPVRIRFTACSTPAQPRVSICDELKSTILDSPCMHSPLCDKEMDDIFYKQYQPVTFDLPSALTFDQSGVTSLEEETDVESIVAAALDCLNNSGRYHNKREQLDSLVKLSKSHLLSQIGRVQDDVAQSPRVRTYMERELELLAEDMAMLVAAKQVADNRVNKLSTALKRVFEHYQMLEQRHKETIPRLEAECRQKASEVDSLGARLQDTSDRCLALVVQVGKKDQQIIGLRTHNSCLERELEEEKSHRAQHEATVTDLRKQLEEKTSFTPGASGDGDLMVLSKSLSGSSGPQDDMTTTVCKTSVTIKKSASQSESPHAKKRRPRKSSHSSFESSSGNISLVVVEENNNIVDTDVLSGVAAVPGLAICEVEEVIEDRKVVWSSGGSALQRITTSLLWTLAGLVLLLVAVIQLGSRAALGGLERAVWPHVELRHYGMPPV